MEENPKKILLPIDIIGAGEPDGNTDVFGNEFISRKIDNGLYEFTIPARKSFLIRMRAKA
jgi:hypothetical protein